MDVTVRDTVRSFFIYPRRLFSHAHFSPTEPCSNVSRCFHSLALRF
jgi:hypothetical protein